MSTTTRERPILFSGPMVRAILDGTKTQTRRVVKPQPAEGLEPCHYSESGWGSTRGNGCKCDNVKCPYGRPGDRLWVRETVKRAGAGACWFAADNKLVYGTDSITGIRMAAHYKYPRDTMPSIHMPRDWSRITLEVTDVMVERVQDISEADAAAEGVEDYGIEMGYLNHRDSFQGLWHSINGPDSWDANPWVWVVAFKRLEGEA